MSCTFGDGEGFGVIKEKLQNKQIFKQNEIAFN